MQLFLSTSMASPTVSKLAEAVVWAPLNLSRLCGRLQSVVVGRRDASVNELSASDLQRAEPCYVSFSR